MLSEVIILYKGGYVISDIDCQNKDKTTITYLGLPTDEDGYPLVPDDVYYIKAVAAYIIHMLDKQEWRKGSIADKVVCEIWNRLVILCKFC